MRVTLQRRIVRLLVLAGCMACAGLSLTGCRQIDGLRGTGYPESNDEVGMKYRPKKPAEGKSSDRFFFDERASQIERHLGI